MRRWMLLGLLSVAACDKDADEDGVIAAEDCDDLNPNVFPDAPDFRGDGCDADCGTEPDADGDDWPDDADCGPSDATVHPCSMAEVDGDGIDSDCDGGDGVRPDGCESADPDAPESTPILAADCTPAS